jgi:hypothetical protein
VSTAGAVLTLGLLALVLGGAFVLSVRWLFDIDDDDDLSDFDDEP